MRVATPALALLLALSIGSRGDEVFEKVGGATFTGYIVPKDAGVGYSIMVDHEAKVLKGDGDYWRPSVAQVTEAEKVVRRFVERTSKNPQLAYPNWSKTWIEWNRKKLAEIEPNYAKYQIQFVGILVRGHREIYCNYFRLLPVMGGMDPSRQFVDVDDGGASFWNVRFVPETKECTELEINGDG
jgi:hypothetical protein